VPLLLHLRISHLPTGPRYTQHECSLKIIEKAVQLFVELCHYFLMQSSQTAFWDSIEENRQPLFRFAFALTGSDDEAKDLVSETVLAAHAAYPKLRNVGGFRKLLYTIIRRIHRRKVWRGRLFHPLEDGTHVEADSDSESSHDIDILLKALDLLPRLQREAVLLFEISELSLEEIRDIQGGSLSGVKSRVTRGRDSLRKLIRDNGRILVAMPLQQASESLIPSILL
jgi:RNA polymerase sigma-70 factor, ECF subfamily